jgi:hypothetical protein
MTARILPSMIAPLELYDLQYKTNMADDIAVTAGFSEWVKKADVAVVGLDVATAAAGASAGKMAVATEATSVALKKTAASAIELGGAYDLMGAQAARAGKLAGAAGLESGGIFGGLSAGTAVLGVGALIAAPLALLGVLEKLTTQQADYAAGVKRVADVTGIDTTQVQVLGHAMEAIGVNFTEFQKMFAMFGKNLEAGLPVLKKYGLTMEDIGVTTTNIGQAFMQVSKFIHGSTDEALNAAVAQATFGRTGQKLIEVLRQGPGFFAEYTKELTNYGVILSEGEVQTAAFTKTAQTQFDLTMEGIKTRFIAPMQSGFSLLFMVLTEGFSKSGDAATRFGTMLSGIIGKIASFVSGLFGLKLTQDDVNKSLDKMQGSAVAALNAINALQEDSSAAADRSLQVSKDQTEALKRQEAATNAVTKAQDDQYESQIALLTAEDKQLSLEQQLLAEERTLEADRLKITQDSQAAALEAYQGNYADSFKTGQQLEQDKQKLGDDTTKQAMSAAQRVLQAQIKAIQDEKKAFDSLQADKLQGYRDASAAIVTAAQDASNATTKAYNAAVTNYQDLSTATKKTITAQLDPQWQKYAEDVVKWIQDPWSPQHQAQLRGLITDWIHAIGGFFDPTKEPGHSIVVAGVTLGSAIGAGIVGGLWDALQANLLNGPLVTLMHALFLFDTGHYVEAWNQFNSAKYQPPSASPNATSSSFGMVALASHPYGVGGRATGGSMAAGAPSWVGEKGPELFVPSVGGQILSHADSMAAAVPSGATYNFNFPNYLGDRAELGRAMRSEMAAVHRY